MRPKKNGAGIEEVQIGERMYTDLSPLEQEYLLLAAKVMVEWIVGEAEKGKG